MYHRALELLNVGEEGNLISPEKASQYRQALKHSIGGIKPGWLHFEEDTDRVFIYDDERN